MQNDSLWRNSAYDAGVDALRPSTLECRHEVLWWLVKCSL